MSPRAVVEETMKNTNLLAAAIEVVKTQVQMEGAISVELEPTWDHCATSYRIDNDNDDLDRLIDAVVNYDEDSYGYNYNDFFGRLIEKQNLAISTIRMAKDRTDFGFTETGYSVFCHASRVVGTKQALADISEECVIKYIESDKGFKASWICPVSIIDAKTTAILVECLKSAILTAIAEKLRDRERDNRARAEHKMLCTRLAIKYNLSDDFDFQTRRDDRSWGMYGRHTCYYYFNQVMSEEQVISVLKEVDPWLFNITPSNGWDGEEYNRFTHIPQSNGWDKWEVFHQSHYTN